MEERRVNKELANIRSKFNEKGLDGYSRRKYVAKLIHIYILGYTVDFGHAEMINLLASPKYPEKQMGYLAVILLLNEGHKELSDSIIHAIRRDLDDANEINICLALQAIANVGSYPMADGLSRDIYKLMISTSVNKFIKKKAALSLLRLYRRFPDKLPIESWHGKIIDMMEEYDLGVSHAATSLILGIVDMNPSAISDLIIPKAVTKLHKIVIQKEFSSDHTYYNIPSPWLQIKLLKLLQYYPLTSDAQVSKKINAILKEIIVNNEAAWTYDEKNPQAENASKAILFEAIQLAIHLNPNSDIILKASNALSRYLIVKTTNIRYLALLTLSCMERSANSFDILETHQLTIFESLRDKDVSIKKRSLDLLFHLCRKENAKSIINQLTEFLVVSDTEIKEELVLKIAILAEKFANESTWYVDTIVKISSIAGEFVSDAIRFRVIQLVSNHPQIQEYAALMCMQSISIDRCNEALIKLCGYIIGEYGHLIIKLPNCNPLEQFKALHSKFGSFNVHTKAVLLTAYFKFACKHPEIREYLVTIFDQYRNGLDLDLYQRAHEYFTILSTPNLVRLLPIMGEAMPPFPKKNSFSIVLQQLENKENTFQEKHAPDAKLGSIYKRRATASSTHAQVENNSLQSLQDYAPNLNSSQDSSLISGLLVINEKKTFLGLSKQDSDFLKTCLLNKSGILYENDAVQISVKSQFNEHLGRLALYVGNKSSDTLTEFKIDLHIENGFSVIPIDCVGTEIKSAEQIFQLYNILCLAPTSTPNPFSISYKINEMRTTIDLYFPLIMIQFCFPCQLETEQFLIRWKQIGGPPREACEQLVLPGESINKDILRAIIRRMGFEVFVGYDPNEDNLVGSCIFHSEDLGKVGCLVRIEALFEKQAFRITLRTINERVTCVMMQVMKMLITAQWK